MTSQREPLVRRRDSLSPVYDDGQVSIYLADCRAIRPLFDRVDAVVTDPPYGDTSLDWDRAPDGEWIEQVGGITDVLWCFGSMRFWLEQGHRFQASWRYGQELDLLDPRNVPSRERTHAV